MYLIINKTTNETFTHLGGFPDLNDMLDNGEKVIIISLYSNTIKIPVSTTLNSITDWHWEDYNINPILPLLK